MYLHGGPIFSPRPRFPPLNGGGSTTWSWSSLSAPDASSCSSSDSGSLSSSLLVLLAVRQVCLVGCWSALDAWCLRESGGARNAPERVLGLGLGPIWHEGGWGNVGGTGWWWEEARTMMWEHLIVYKHVCMHAEHAGKRNRGNGDFE